jgi:hypothetical protein
MGINFSKSFLGLEVAWHKIILYKKDDSTQCLDSLTNSPRQIEYQISYEVRVMHFSLIEGCRGSSIKL